MKAKTFAIFAAFLIGLSAAAPSMAPAGLADAAWPMFQGNAAHTGRSTHTGPQTPVLKWAFRVEGMPGSPAIGADGTLYLPTGMLNEDSAGYLYAVNPNGTQKWRYRFAGIPASTAPAIAEDGTIYVHVNGDDGNQVAVEKLYALNPDGSFKWLCKPNGDHGMFTSSVQSAPVIGADGTVYIGSINTHLCAVDPNDGSLKWSAAPGASSISSSPAIGPDGTIYCLDASGLLAAYTSSGARNWTLQLASVSGGDGSPSVDADGTIYVATSGSGELHAVNPTGTLKWSKAMGFAGVATPAISADGTIYFSDDGLHALGPEDGAEKWHSSDTALFSSSSPVVGGDGTIYWREAWTFRAVKPDGTAKWNLDMPSPASSGLYPSPALAADGTLYIPQPDAFDPDNQYLKA
jgi:outer membrane protein assembly factor BamB